MGSSIPSGWAEVINNLDEKHDDAHTRLRTDHRALAITVESNYRHFEDQLTIMRADIRTMSALMNAPIDATKLVLSTKSIIALLIASLGIAASLWNISNKIDSNQRANELQMKSLSESIATQQRQYELLRYEVQTIKEAVSKEKK